MSGVLTVAVEVNPNDALPPYALLYAGCPEIAPIENGKEIHTVRLLPGEILAVNPLAVHCTTNAGETPCSFLCIEGVGDYEFVPVATSVTRRL